ncbi:PAS domain S-box protein [Acuticoccus sediminis]|uniref:PAS domain S-box protein n=1 Tax=Acuticoccus sediminis TaxID=2184697 RepID=UPI001CFD33C9|nr:PAS domain S-box protein [Acuticoccus sediminis]
MVTVFRSLSLTRQLLIAMVTLVLLTSASVGVVVYWAVERALIPQGVLRLEGDARQLATQLVSRTTGYRSDLAARTKSGAIAGFIDASTGSGTDARLDLDAATWRRIVENLFFAELAAKSEYLQLRLLDAEGNEVIRVDRQKGDEPPRIVPAAELQAKQSRPYVANTLALDPGEIYISPLDLNREHGEIVMPFTPVLRFAAPMDGPDGQRYGLLVLNVDMRQDFRILRDAVLPGGDLFLVNAEGDYLLHPDPAKEFAFDRGPRVLFPEDRPALSAAVGAVAAGSDLFSADGEATRAVAWAQAPLAQVGPPLTVVLSAPSRIARAAPAIRNSAAGVGAIAALLAAIAVGLAGRAIMRPIVAMTHGLEDASAGRPVALPVTRGGEIGVLARALNDYIERERFDGAIVNGSSDAILTTDHDGLITRWNPAAAHLFECPAESAIGRDVDAVIAPDGAFTVRTWLNDTMGESEGGVADITRLRRDGTTCDIALRASPVHAPDGTIMGMSIIARDMTAERIAQEMFRVSVEYSPAGKVLCGPDGRIKLVNAQTEAAFGYTRDELIDQPVELLVPQDVRGEHASLMRAFLASPERRSMGNDREVFGRRKSGEIFPIEVGLTPVPSRSGTLVLAAIVDVSAQRAAQRDLIARTQELERSNKDLMQFAYVASHDLQEPLRMVASFTQLLADRYKGQLDERADKYIHFAVDGAKRMQALINDLLDYSRVGASTKPLEPVEVATVWQRVQRMLLSTIRETEATVEAGPLPTVMADAEQLTRLLQNLLSNSIKFRSDVPPHITLAAERQGEFWQFTLSDNGIGFESRDAARIFDMFQRLHERGKYEGTGLGLAIAKRIIDQHGGRIWAESAPGEGTRFSFTLRAAEPARS